MIEFTRKNFRIWLESLPRGEPFCNKHNCPIAQFTGLETMVAYELDETLAWKIDDISVARKGLIIDWESLVPDDVLAVLNKLETLKKEQTPVAKPETCRTNK